MGPFRPRYRARDLFRAERDYLSRAIQSEQPNVVHAHWTYEFALGAIESGVPTVVTAHDAPLHILRFNPTPYRLMRTLMACQVASRARRMTAVTPMVAQHFRRYFRHGAAIRVIPNGIPDEWFQESGRAKPAGGVVYASVLNGWGVLKNGATLMEAFASVRRALPGSQLLMFGDGHGAGEAAETWARAKGLTENVRFVGAVDRPELMERLRRSAHILVHPSREESFGMTIAEAMALGLPVIAGVDSGAAATTLDQGRSGMLVDVRSPEALATGMLSLARNPGLCAELAEAGCRSAREKFQMGKILPAYAEIYREAAGA
jgi:glycosyltransferase involved in cell wall biosynthesis